jgi:hypothetical protein
MIFNKFSLFIFFRILPKNRVLLWPQTYGTFEKASNDRIINKNEWDMMKKKAFVA